MTRIHVYHVNRTVPAVRNDQTTAPVVTIILFSMITSVMQHVPLIPMRQKIMGTFPLLHLHYILLDKVKLFLYRPWRPLGLREVEAPTFSDIWLTDGGKVASPMRQPLFTPRVHISVRVWVYLRTIVRLEGLGKLKKSTSFGTWTGDQLTCSIVPQPTTLPCAPIYYQRKCKK
jgi:hypothetical protein